jgi:hypothetical protein
MKSSWEAFSQFAAARYCRDRNPSRRYPVSLLLLDVVKTEMYPGGI